MKRLALPAALVAALLAPAAARATDFCVAPNTTCGGTNVATLEAALNAADDATDADRVFLGAATYTAVATTGFDYNAASSPVEIIGAGVAQTKLTGPASTTRVLRLQGGDGSSVHDLTVELPATVALNAIGIDLSDAALRVAVTADPTQTMTHRGVDMRQGGSFADGTVTLTQAIGNVRGIFVTNGTTDALVARSTITARTGVNVNPSSSATVDRITATSEDAGVTTLGGTVTVTSSVLRPVDGGAGLSAFDQPGIPGTANANGVTIVGDGSGGTDGVFAVSFQGNTATVNVTNSIIRGVENALSRSGGAGTANVTATFSDFDPATNTVDTGAGTLTPPTGMLSPGSNLNVDPQFVNAASDFHLLSSSPLVDAGDPAATTGFDFDGNALVTDGNGDGTARRDVGAFERAAVPAPDPVPPAGGDQPPAGGGATTTTPPAQDLLAPVLAGLRAVPARVRSGRGARLSFSLDEAATVAIELQRAVAGRREGRVCRRPSRRNRRGRRCTRHVRAARLTVELPAGEGSVRLPARLRGRALPPGRYRAVVTATDAAGNGSAARTVGFTVVRG